ncbi:MAG: hypothetical protein EBR82_52630 [Caulobacteraceae bacterium]|nr:hypothetical protein [Caulobacteraceae bacterium]
MSLELIEITKPQIKASVPTNFIEKMEYDCKIIGNKVNVKEIKSKNSQKEYSICSVNVSYEGKSFEATILTDVKEYASKMSVNDVVKVGVNVDGRYKNAFIIA